MSEMFSYRLEKPENKEHDVTTVEEGPKCLRGATSGSFYNEICHSDDEILDTSSLNQCCSRRQAWLPLMLKRGRALCAQELNITRLVATSRCSMAAQSLLGERGT